MKHLYLIFLLFPLGMTPSSAQSTALVPKVHKAVYFDVSPPLRDMVHLQPGLIDRTWKDGVVKNNFDLNKDNYPAPSDIPDPGLQDSFGSILIDTTIANFNGLWNVSGSVPPDTHGEAGPNHFFQVVNSSYAIFNKAGARIFGPVGSSSVWNGMPNNFNSGDAVVLYDEMANRWLFTQFSFPNSSTGPFFQMIAVSQTPDPMGAWYRWEYEFPSLPDYPKFGVWPDGYYMSANNFGWGWEGNEACAFDRTAMLAGDPDAIRISFTLSPGSAGFITIYPSDCDGTFPPIGTPNYFAYIKTGSPQNLGIYEFHADFANPNNSTFANLLTLPVNSFNPGLDGIPQKETSTRLDEISDRLMYRLQFRKFNGYSSMVVNHTVNVGSGKAGIRWYELRKTTAAWSVYQQATYSPADNNSRWMGSMAMDTAGSIALGYSVSGASMYPSIRVTGRLKNDPLNQMTVAEKTIVEGGGSQTGVWSGRSRWGDYSAMSVDPANPTTFWYTTEYYGYTSNSSWLTRVGSFTFSNLFSSSASATPVSYCAGDSSQLKAIPYGGSGNYTYSWSSIPPGFTSAISNPVVYPTDTTIYIVATSDGTQTRHDTTRVNVVYPPTAFAGNDTTICAWLADLELHGTASNYKRISWATLGDGHFSNLNTLNTIYKPGPKDKANGIAELKLVAFAKNPCSGMLISTKIVTIDPCTSIPENSPDMLALKIQPNPASDHVTLTINGLQQTAASLTVTGMDGRIHFSATISPENEQVVKLIDISGYAKGVYIVQVKTDSRLITGQLMVR